MEILTGTKPFKGTITIPPSKSMSHRALIAAGLSNGSSHIMSALNADDIEATLECLLALGVESQVLKSTVVKSGLDVIVEGLGGRWPSSATIKARESGSTLRFMILWPLPQKDKRLSKEKVVS